MPDSHQKKVGKYLHIYFPKGRRLQCKPIMVQTKWPVQRNSGSKCSNIKTTWLRLKIPTRASLIGKNIEHEVPKPTGLFLFSPTRRIPVFWSSSHATPHVHEVFCPPLQRRAGGLVSTLISCPLCCYLHEGPCVYK